MYDALIWIGTALALAGVAMLGWCILRAVRVRRAKLDDAAARAALRRVVTVNLAAVGVSALGLMCVVAGIFLR
jgi:hypothetical protein